MDQVPIIGEVGLDRILTESDGPNRYRGGVTGRPAMVADVLTTIAGIWEVAYGEAEQQIEENFNCLRLGSAPS